MDGIKIERKIDVNELRTVCIRYELYTRGTNEQYSDMFAQARSARTDEQFVSVAQDIWEHSDADDVDNNRSGFDFTTLLWYVLNDCVRTYVSRV